MRRRLALIPVVLVVPLGAHHLASAEFDTSRPVTLRGIVRHVQWTNPHAWIRMDVKQPGGSAGEWQVQVASVGFLRREGITEATLTAGTEVAVDVFPAKNGSRIADARAGGTLALANGLKVVTPQFAPDPAAIINQLRGGRVPASSK
jgi:hypothetical protein